MKQLFVVSHDTYASGLTPASSDLDNLGSLASGAWAMIDKDPASATFDQVVNIAATSEAETPAKFMLVVKSANGLKYSPIITKSQAICTYTAYAAPAAKVMNINVTYTPVVGDTVGFVVTDLTKPAHVLSRNRAYSLTVGVGDTESTLNTALIALVNADTKRVVTASAGTDIVLTGITAGNAFTVSPIGAFGPSTVAAITITTAYNSGTGTAAQLADYEKMCNTYLGKANYPEYRDLFFTNVSELTAGATYNQFIVKHFAPGQRPMLSDDVNPIEEIAIAVLSSLTGSGDGKSMEGLNNFDADLGNIF